MAEAKDRAGAITLPPLIYVVILVAGVYWRELIPLTLGSLRLRVTVGATLLTAGISLLVWAMRTMTRARTTFNPWLPSTTIVSWGPFRFTRNPIYLGDLIIYIGLSIMFDSVLALFLIPLVVAIVTFGVIRREEAYLSRKFGEEYREYARRVRRWL